MNLDGSCLNYQIHMLVRGFRNGVRYFINRPQESTAFFEPAISPPNAAMTLRDPTKISACAGDKSISSSMSRMAADITPTSWKWSDRSPNKQSVQQDSRQDGA